VFPLGLHGELGVGVGQPQHEPRAVRRLDARALDEPFEPRDLLDEEATSLGFS